MPDAVPRYSSHTALRARLLPAVVALLAVTGVALMTGVAEWRRAVAPEARDPRAMGGAMRPQEGETLTNAPSPRAREQENRVPARGDIRDAAGTSAEEPTGTSTVPQVTIGAARVAVELARTPEEWARGLSGRAPLKEGTGMLFVFPTPAPRAFWMKDMRFALDIIWIGGDLRVVDVTENALPESYPATFSPRAPAQYVLEVPAGFAQRYRIRPGMEVTFSGVAVP